MSSSYYPSPPPIPARKSPQGPFPKSGAPSYGGQPTSGYGLQGGQGGQGVVPPTAGYGVQPPGGQVGLTPGYGVQPPGGPTAGYSGQGVVPPTAGYVVQPPGGQVGLTPGYSGQGMVPPTAGYGVQPPGGLSSGYGVQPPTGQGVRPPVMPPSDLTSSSGGYGGFPSSHDPAPAQRPTGPGPSPVQVPMAPNYGGGVRPPPTGTLDNTLPSAGVRPLEVSPVRPPGDWFGNSGFATAIGAAAMSAMAGNENAVKQIMATTFDAERQKSLSWFQSQVLFFKEYFNVTHAYVRWKLIFVLLPFIQSTSGQIVSRATSRDVPTSDEGDNEKTASQGSGVGLRLFPGRKPDLYIPIMGFITFILIHSLSKWDDFHPDDLYNLASLGILLGFIEVLILKGASYVLNVAHWKFTDIIAVCGYKFANLSLSIFLLILFSFGGRPVWIGLYVFAAAMAGVTVHRGLLSAGNYNASTQNYLGTHSPNMEKLLSLVAGGAQFFWIWILMPSMKIVATVASVSGGAGGVRQVIESTGN
jgi:hypothetical protein